MATTQGEQPRTIADIYRMYDDAKFQDFVDAAVPREGRNSRLNVFHTINLRILIANTAEHPSDAAHFHQYAQLTYRITSELREAPEEIRLLNKLRTKLERVGAAISAERQGYDRELLQFYQPSQFIIARITARVQSIEAGLESDGGLLGLGHDDTTREMREEGLAGQEDILGDRLRAFLEGERDEHQTQVEKHFEENERRQAEVERLLTEMEEREAQIETQLARINEIDRELERL